jgi:hypothetical protein
MKKDKKKEEKRKKKVDHWSGPHGKSRAKGPHNLPPTQWATHLWHHHPRNTHHHFQLSVTPSHKRYWIFWSHQRLPLTRRNILRRGAKAEALDVHWSQVARLPIPFWTSPGAWVLSTYILNLKQQIPKKRCFPLSEFVSDSRLQVLYILSYYLTALLTNLALVIFLFCWYLWGSPSPSLLRSSPTKGRPLQFIYWSDGIGNSALVRPQITNFVIFWTILL